MSSLLRYLPSEEVCAAKCMELGLFMRRLPDGDTTHTAITLHPQRMKYDELEELYKVQELWNEAVDNTARNFTFLRSALKETAMSDVNFTGKLLHILDVVYLQPADDTVLVAHDKCDSAVVDGDDDDDNKSKVCVIKQEQDRCDNISTQRTCELECQLQPVFQSLMLGIFRTDYIRAKDTTKTKTHEEKPHNHHSSESTEESSSTRIAQSNVSLWKNVEINTVSVSFAGLAPLVREFHRFLKAYKQSLTVKADKECASFFCEETQKTANSTEETQNVKCNNYNNNSSERDVNSNDEVPYALAAAFHAWIADAKLYEVCDKVNVLTLINSAKLTLENSSKERNSVFNYTLSNEECVKAELPLKSLTEMRQYLLPIVLVVIQEGERNTADQFKLLLHFTEKYKIITLRRTFAEIHTSLKLYRARYENHKGPAAPFGVLDSRYLVAVVYFRNSYVPQDFPTEMHWEVRLQLERINAIKCPSIPYHLMTFKKLQQEMTNIDYVLKPISFNGDAAKAKTLSRHFMPQYSLNKLEYDTQGASQCNMSHDPEYWIQQAIAHPDRFVLKPQLEGGGNLIANDEMKKLLCETSPSDPLYQHIRKEYILMSKIQYEPMSSVFLRQGKCYAMDNNVCSELGIYGVILSNGVDKGNTHRNCTNCEKDAFHRDDCTTNKALNGYKVDNNYSGRHNSNTFVCNKAAGYLVRSKASNMEDGGVMAGVACLDSMEFVEIEIDVPLRKKVKTNTQKV